MKRMTLLSGLLLLALAVAACAPSTPTVLTTSTSSVPVTGETETPVVEVTETQAEAATTEAPTEAATAAATEATTGTDVTIATSSNPDVAEPFLVDDEGRALYLFTNDTQNSGASSCTGDCLANWPAVVVTGTPTAGEGVDASLLGTITRDDGTIQATYNGWPLYYYVEDTAAGDINGQGVGDVWFLVTGAGDAIP